MKNKVPTLKIRTKLSLLVDEVKIIANPVNYKQ